MFDITDNFAVAVRLNYIYLMNSVSLSTGKRGGFDCTLKDGSGTEVYQHFMTETEVWAALPGQAPDLLSQLHASISLYDRGLARRAEMYQSSSLEAAKAEFEKTPHLMFRTLLETLGGRLIGAKPKLRPKATRRGISLWELRGRVRLSHYPEPVALVLKVFPSPIKPDAWLMRVHLPGTTSEVIRENQVAIQRAIYLLEGHGVTIEDVTQGTNLEL